MFKKSSGGSNKKNFSTKSKVMANFGAPKSARGVYMSNISSLIKVYMSNISSLIQVDVFPTRFRPGDNDGQNSALVLIMNCLFVF